MIIKSLLDSDLYKFSMQQAVLQLYPRVYAQYQFINRGGHSFKKEFADKLRMELSAMPQLQLTRTEQYWMQMKFPFLTPVYLDFLSGYTFDPSEVDVNWEDGVLDITITGPWYRTILWEVPLMAIISELYFADESPSYSVHERANRIKGETLKKRGVKFADFGTRRRFSHDNHRNVIIGLKSSGGDSFVGTSNVAFAMEFGLKAIGTQAHEWFMFHAAKYGFRMANEMALEKWIDVYQGDLGIALPDTFTTDVFLDSFNMKYAKLFDGVRQDSGNPVEFMEKMIRHYKSLGIDPASKTIVFSDGLNVKEVLAIESRRHDIKASYGIGTNLTNDVGVKPMNMVIKMTACSPDGDSWVNTVKLSDSIGKHTGDQNKIEDCCREFGISRDGTT